MMFQRLIARLRRKLIYKHVHVWITDPDNWAKRSCECGARSFLMEKRFPAIGEPKYSWSDFDDH